MTRRRTAGAVGAAVAVALAGVLALAERGAAAEDPDVPVIAVRRVDSRNAANTVVDFTWEGDPAAVTGAAVRQDGDRVDRSDPVGLVAGGGQSGVVVVLDTSSSGDDNALLTEARHSVVALAAASAGRHDVGVVAAGAQSAVLRRLASPTTVEEAVAQVTPAGEGALYDGVVRAVAQFGRQPQLLPVVVVVTDGVHDPSVSADRAVGAALDVGAVVHVVALDDGGLDSGSLRALTTATGGRYLETDDVTRLDELLTQLRPTLDGQYRFTFASTVERGVTDLAVAIDGVSSEVSFVAGSVATGTSRLRLQDDARGGGIEFLTNAPGKAIGMLLALLAAGLLAWSVIMIFVRDETVLQSVIKHYEGYSTPVVDNEDSDGRVPALAHTSIMQRAVELTGQLAERRGLVTKTEALLERANLPLRAAEALFFYVIAVLLFAVAAVLVSQSVLATGLMLLVTGLAPPAVVTFLANRRRKQFESLLPDTLQLLAGTLRAGYSIMQAVEAITQEVDEPMAKELRRVVTESRLGRPLEDSLEAVAQRMASKDFAWAVMAIRIQREVGGNLAELLMTVSDTMRARERLRREIRALTAEGRMSAIILGILPLGMGLIIWTINRAYIETLVDDGFGQLLLFSGAALAIGGFMWMRKIIEIEI